MHCPFPTVAACGATALWLLSAPVAQAPGPDRGAPRTTPERTEHRQTSGFAEVQQFVAALAALPHGDRLTVHTAGKSHEGRDLLVIAVKDPKQPEPTGGRLRAVILGNIHAGEVEGKEASQLLLRELALGDHGDLLAALELWFVPVHNVDGNEKVDARNRAEQNGPDAVGQRANGQGLDLNRDFLKAEAPETRMLLDLCQRVDPHLFVDLHTTNGSHHGYHLTYAPSLSPNVDRDIARQSRALLDATRRAMRDRHRFETFDYGNFETRDWEGSGAPTSTAGVRGWWTYDHRPRYGVNWFGLRNRIAVLSEAYSYCDFATRIAATRAFVLELLRATATARSEVLAACARADARLVQPEAPVFFGFDTAFGDPEQLDVLVGKVDKVAGPDGKLTRLARAGDGVPERMPVVRSFRARQQIALPDAWAVPDPWPELRELLQRHGIESTLLAAPRAVSAEHFAVTQKRKPKRPFQGHQELVLGGQWQPAKATELPPGTLLVPARQRLARLAAQLLEPTSEDSLSTWNLLEARSGDLYPVLRVAAD